MNVWILGMEKTWNKIKGWIEQEKNDVSYPKQKLINTNFKIF